MTQSSAYMLEENALLLVGILPQTVLAGCCKADGNEGTKEQIARISLSSSVVHLLEKEASQNSYLRFIKGQKKETVSCIF